jgi:hypothetical protein
MTTSRAPTLPSDATAWLSVPAASATLLASFSEVLAAPSATACQSQYRDVTPPRTATLKRLVAALCVTL